MSRKLTAPLLQQEMERALEAGAAWPDLDLSRGGVDTLIETVRGARIAEADGGFIPGAKAVSAPITNWQDEIEVAVTLIRSEEHTSELQSLMRISYAVFCLKKTQVHTIYQPPPP